MLANNLLSSPSEFSASKRPLTAGIIASQFSECEPDHYCLIKRLPITVLTLGYC